MDFLAKLFQWIKKSHRKFWLLLASVLIFSFIIFPFDDLGDLVSSQISNLTKGNLFVNFNKMKVNLLPAGLHFKQVHIESIRTPALNADDLTITPSLLSLISKKPYGSIEANGFMQGQVKLSMAGGKKSESGLERERIELRAQKIALKDLRALANLQIPLQGNLDIQSLAQVDLAFQEQPDVDLNLMINSFELPSANVETQMGPITLPDLKLSSINLKGRMSAGRFIIDSGVIGSESDEIFGTVKGSLGLSVINNGGMISTQLGSYKLELDLKMKKSFQDRANLFLVLIDQYKRPLSDGAQYKIKLEAQNMLVPPSISAP